MKKRTEQARPEKVVPPDQPTPRRLPPGTLKAEADEAIKAGRIPADSWQRLAREALGDLRHAVSKYLLLAEEGDPELIAELPIYTRQMVEACNRLARRHPEAMAGIAGEWIEWPMLVSWHYPKPKDFSDLVARLGLGKASLLSPPAKATWKPDTPINRFLLDFFQGWVNTDNASYDADFPPGTPRLNRQNWKWFLDEVVMPRLDEIQEEEGWEGIPVLRDLIKKVPYEPDQRSAVRNRLKKALRALACSSG
jgi:hypothetical protein